MSNGNDLQVLHSPTVWIAKSVEEAVELKKQFTSEAEYVAGSTLLQLQWINGRKMPKHLISIEQIPSMNKIEKLEDENIVALGPLVTLGSYQTNEIVKEFLILCEALKTIAAPAVRNRGTIGGNIMGGVGDLIPLFLSLDAVLRIHNGEEYQTVSMKEFLTQKSNFPSLLTMIYLPIEENATLQSVFYKKIGRRETFTAAILTVAGNVKWDEKGNITNIKLAIGGGDNLPMRLEKIEQFLQNENLNEINWKQFYQIAMSEINPIEDVFVSGTYRKKVAANLLIAELQSQLASKGYREGHVNEI